MKRFNTTGACFPDEHYMLDAENRLTDVRDLITNKQYFVIHAARQSGKTTLLNSLEYTINEEGRYYALYCSLEAVQSFPEPERGIPQIVNCIISSIEISSLPLKKNVDEIITARMFVITGEPLDKRQSGYDELLDIRDKINKYLK